MRPPERGCEAADVLCLPSMHEIFPVSFLEAWSVGTAVVASDIETLRELIGKSGGGATAARDAQVLGALLAKLLAAPADCRRLGDAGRRWWLANATPDHVVNEQERIYEDVLPGNRGRSPERAGQLSQGV